ncbi:spoIIIAH-like family protein [[Clostridium] sordellii ATCC 9714]|nr:spoIIIAH-like family protein [[Clostridium] sordellii ATCC 9714] [Paeniclostridium sordellii ATCC 9714]
MTSDKNMKKASYAIDMKMNREKQRNELTEDLNEIINNPSTAEKQESKLQT